MMPSDVVLGRRGERVLRSGQVVEMAGGEVAGRGGAQGWLLGAAAVEGVGAAGVKAAARWRVDRARHVAPEDDALTRKAGLRHRNSRQQRLRVGVLGSGKESPLRRQLD